MNIKYQSTVKSLGKNMRFINLINYISGVHITTSLEIIFQRLQI